MKTMVVIRTTFSATHNWPDCDIDEVSFLKYAHRHLFHVEMKFDVEHDNRDIEFIQMKNRIDKYLRKDFDGQYIGTMSCEYIARHLLDYFGADFVSVFEDNENGAEVMREDSDN